MRFTSRHSIATALSVVTLMLGSALSAQAQTTLAYWNFNDSTPASDTTQTQLQGQLFSADGGVQSATAVITSNFIAIDSGSGFGGSTTTGINSFAGSTVNALNGDGSLQALALQGSTTGGGANANNGNYIQFQISMTGFQAPTLSFATQRTSTGFGTAANPNQLSYSTDGLSFTNLPTGSYIPAAAFALQTFDLSSVTSLNNASKAFFRITFNGVSSNSGNNRFDNVQINAAVFSGGGGSAAPEPGTIALLLSGAGTTGLALLRRRKS